MKEKINKENIEISKKLLNNVFLISNGWSH